jgi:rubrerythrin
MKLRRRGFRWWCCSNCTAIAKSKRRPEQCEHCGSLTSTWEAVCSN